MKYFLIQIFLQQIFNGGGWSELGILPYISGLHTDKSDFKEKKVLKKSKSVWHNQLEILSVADYVCSNCLIYLFYFLT